MSLPVSPLKPITKLDKIQEKDLYYAADTSEFPLRYLHFTGDSLISDTNYAWYGTRRQFEALCQLKEWDALSLVRPMKPSKKG